MHVKSLPRRNGDTRSVRPNSGCHAYAIAAKRKPYVECRLLCLSAPEHEEMAREGILPQQALDQHSEPIDTLTHVGVEGQMHLHARWKQRHDACSSLPCAVSDGASVTSTATNIGAAAGFISCFQRNRTRSAIP